MTIGKRRVLRNRDRGYSAAAIVLMGAALCLGCGGSTSSLSGTVSYAGQAIKQGSVSLRPAAGTKGAGAATEIIDGRYEIAADAGLKPGDYSVVVMAFREQSGRTAKPPLAMALPSDLTPAGETATAAVLVQYLPDKYNLSTELTASLQEGANVRDFDLK